MRPLNRWISVPWPPRGKGVLSGKHVSSAWCPEDGRLYFVGGDYATLRGTGSYVQQTFSLSLAERLASPADPNAGWREEFPYCAPQGKIAPKGPDTVGWVWDVLRRCFWMVPGQMVPSATGCPGQSNINASDAVYKLGSLMTFTPSFTPGVYGTWEEPTGHTYPGRIIGAARHCVYDAAEDRILRARYDGLQGGLIFEVMSCNAVDQWQSVLLDRARGLRNALGKNCRIEHEYLAWDPAARRCYAVDGNALPVPRLMAWDLPSNLLLDFGEVPGGPYPVGLLNSEWSHVVWSARHQRLFFYRLRDPEGFFAWDPATQTWEILSLASDRPDVYDGRAFGRCLAYDPAEDLLMLYGGVGSAAKPCFYVLRYEKEVAMATVRVIVQTLEKMFDEDPHLARYTVALVANDGAVVAEQTFPVAGGAPGQVEFLAVPIGTGYLIRAAQWDVQGAQIGADVLSASFDVAGTQATVIVSVTVG